LALKLGVSVGVSEALVVVAATSMLVRRLLTRLCACVGEMWRASSSCQMDLHKSTAHHITHTHTCLSFRLSLYACVCVCVGVRHHNDLFEAYHYKGAPLTHAHCVHVRMSVGVCMCVSECRV